MSVVFVIDSQGKPLLPTHPARARKLLNGGKAIVELVVPFTIRLRRNIENPVGSFTVGIDDGAKYVGIAIKNDYSNKIVFRGVITHRLDVKRKMEQRRYLRSTRRQRLRYRKRRNKNRKRCEIAASLRYRKEVIIRVLNDQKKRLNLLKVVVEEVCCRKNSKKLNYYLSIARMGKKFLKKSIEKIGMIYERTFGFNTKKERLKLKITKKHSNDACAVLKSSLFLDREYLIKPKRNKIWEANPKKTCIEKNGFRHYDLVKAKSKTRGTFVGSVRSLCSYGIRLRTKFHPQYKVTYKNSKLLQRSNGLVYTY